MEDQGKRLLLAVAIAFGLMLVWSKLFPPETPPKSDETAETREESAERADDAEPGPERPDRAEADDGEDAEADDGEDAEAEAEPVERGEERRFVFDFENFRAELSSYDAALVSWTLKGEQLVDRERGAPEDLVRLPGEEHRPLQIGFEGSTFEIPRGAEWRGEKKSDTEIDFTWESEDLRVIKRMTFHPEHYAVELTVDVEVLARDTAKQSLRVGLLSFQDPKADVGGGMARVEREWKAACYLDEEVETWSAKTLAKKGPKLLGGEVGWGGFLHSYFLAAVAPKNVGDRRIECDAAPVEEIPGGMRVELVFPTVELESQARIKETMVAYFGPKYLDELETISADVGYGSSLGEAVDLGFLSIIAGPLLWLLKWFQGFVVSWGLAIIALTLLVKGLTLPWTHKSMKSMQAMSKLRPQMDKIREKYKDDKQRQQVEIMNLFKSQKVNPMAGCLPMLLQMPIWFALYRALTVAAELYQAEFLWMPDLTQSDPYYIMPVLLTGMMFAQTKLSPTTATGAQQKMLMYGMPAMFGVFSLFFPAGLTLYIFTNTLLTAVHNLYVRRERKAAEAGATGGGKGGGESVASPQVIDVEAEEKPAAEESVASAPTPGAGKKSGGKGGGKSGGKGKKRGKKKRR